ncbi:MAG: MMPL family transporter [Thermoplasmata archaeon]
MVFRGLADSVVKHHRKIIVAWLALMIISVPLAMKLNEVLVYEETKAAGEEMRAESITAGEIIEKEFPGARANSSVIIVLTGDVSTPAARDFLLDVERTSLLGGRVKTIENFTSIYSIYRQVMERSALELPPVLGALEANLTSVAFMIQLASFWGGINGSLFLVWGAPAMFAQLWENLNQSALMIYGIPFLYQQTYEGTRATTILIYGSPAALLEAWSMLSAIPDIEERNLQAFNLSWAGLNSSIQDEEQRELVRGYHSAVFGYWKESFNASNASVYLDNSTPPEVRAQSAAQAVAPIYFNFTSPSNETQLAMRAVLNSFNVSNFSDPVAISRHTTIFAWQLIQAGLAGSSVPGQQLQLMRSYYDAFAEGWEASWLNSSLNGSTTLERAAALTAQIAPAYLRTAFADEPMALQLGLAVLQWLNLSTWTSPYHISELANSTFTVQLRQTVADMGLPAEMLHTLEGYYLSFYQAWITSLSNVSLLGAPAATRAEWVVHQVAPQFIARVSETNATAGAFMAAAYASFNISTCTDVANLTNRLTGAALVAVRSSMEGYIASGRLHERVASAVRAGLETFASIWNRTFDPNDPLYLPPSAPLENRTELAIGRASAGLFGPNGTGGGTFPLDITSLSDPSRARNASIDLFLAGLGGRVAINRTFLAELYEELGPLPDPERARELVAGVINSSVFGEYPVRLPREIERSFVSPKNTTMIVMVTFGTKSNQVLRENIAELRSILSKGRGAAGVRTYVTGSQAMGLELEEQAFRDVERIDPVTVGIVLILVGLFFFSVLAPFFPFIGIGVALLASQTLLFIVGTLIAKIHYSTNILLFVILMGTGMDYAIFILARYREERKEGGSKEEAIRTSVTWAGESIATSGLAVMIGFGAMVLSDFAMIRTMGLVLAMAIGIGILAALTFVPSVLMIVGDRIFWPSRPDGRGSAPTGSSGPEEAGAGSKGETKGVKGGAEPGPPGKEGKVPYFTSAVRFSLRRPWTVIGVCTILFIPSLYLLLVMEPSFDFFEGMPRTEAREGIDAMAEGFGRGEVMPSQVVVQFREPVWLGNNTYNTTRLDSVDALSRALENITVVDERGEKVRIIRSATPSSYYLGQRVDQIDWRVFGEETKNSTLAGAFGKSNRTVLITLVFDREPLKKESLEAVPVLRSRISEIRAADPALSEARVLVGGTTAGMYDIRRIIDDSMAEMRVLVIIGIFVLLLIVLGSLLIPATAILSVGIGIAWTIAATMGVFQFWGGTHVLWLVPLILFIVLMGLGMDYNIFLITRVREEVGRGRTHEEAIQRAVERTGGIITICGLIMAGAFGSMMLSTLGLLQQFGFALFLAILLDTFVIRIYLMPAILKLAGRWSWYAPGPLQRVRIGPDGRGGEVRRRKG